jgi:hypothetical protein
MRFFNAAGPGKSDIHYMPPIERLPGVRIGQATGSLIQTSERRPKRRLVQWLSGQKRRRWTV